MASTPIALRTCGIIICVILQTFASVNNSSGASIQSFKVGSIFCDKKNCKYLLEVRGGEFVGQKSWRLTSVEGVRGGQCDVIYPNYELREIETSLWSSSFEIIVPNIENKIFFCIRENSGNPPFGGQWTHLGVKYFLHPSNDAGTRNIEKLPMQSTNVQEQTKDGVQEVNNNWADLSHDTDVNYLSDAPRPSMTERDDIEVMINDKYVPLNELEDRKSYIDAGQFVNDVYNNIEKREVNCTDMPSINSNSKENNKINIDDTEKVIEIINYTDVKYDYNKNNNIITENSEKFTRTSDTDDVSIEADSINHDSEEYATSNANIETSNTEHSDKSEVYSLLEHMRFNDNIESSKEFNDIQLSRENTEDFNNIEDIDELRVVGMLNENPRELKPDYETNFGFNKIEPIKEYNNHNENSKDFKANIGTTFGFANMESIKEIVDKESDGNPIASIPNKFGYTNIESMREHNDIESNENSRELTSDLRTYYKDINDSDTAHENFRDEKKINNLEQFNENAFGSLASQLPEFADMMKEDSGVLVRRYRQVSPPDMDFTSVKADPVMLNIEGVRVETSAKDPWITEEGIPSVLADTAVTLRVFGVGITPYTVIAFTHDPQEFGQPCKFLLKGEYMVKGGTLTPKSALFDITAPIPITSANLYVCAKNLKPGITDPSKDEEKYLHQGVETWKMLASHTKLLPLWFSLSLIMICLMFSALFSGLNLGLMSLDRTELKIISNTGTEQERKYARAIMPVRDHGNYLLCSILLGNVAVNSTFTILLDELTSGLFAVIFSTLAIVLLGEITPQAICSRHGLMVGAKSIMITKAVMALTAPLAFPVSKLLDYFLGEEIGSVYNRERLKELVKVTTDVNDLDKDEVNIISGALELRKKTVSDVMTKLEDVFMLPISSVLDFETMSEIVKSGYSRIPVYEGGRGNIVTVLFIKDLAFVDPDDNTPLRTLCQYYQNPCNFVFEDVTLDVMFKQFKEGHKGHMAFVHRINNEGEGDPFYETIGLVTLEDVIEEMIQAEIVDETDVFLDNRTKRRRNRPQNKLQDFAAFAERHENQRIHISPQLTLATFQFLSTSVDAFRPDTVSETVLRRLLKQDVIHHIKLKGKTKKDPSTYVFQQGKPVDYFVLILEGRVEVTVGRENLVFEAGPFTYFGIQALTQTVGVAESPTPSAMGSLQNINMDSILRHTFVPDYSVRAIAELYYLTVKRTLYLAAKRATLMEKGALSKGATNEQFDTEVDKLLQSVDEDISISGEHKTPSRQVSPHPLPVSPAPRASLVSHTSHDRNGDLFARPDEQEKLLK